MADPLELIEAYVPRMPQPRSWADVSPFQAVQMGAHNYLRSRAEQDASSMQQEFMRSAGGLKATDRGFADHVREAYQDVQQPQGLWNNPYARSVFQSRNDVNAYISEKQGLAVPDMINQGVQGFMADAMRLAKTDPDYEAKLPALAAGHIPAFEGAREGYQRAVELSADGLIKNLATQQAAAAMEQIRQEAGRLAPNTFGFRDDMLKVYERIRAGLSPTAAAILDQQFGLYSKAQDFDEDDEARRWRQQTVRPAIQDFRKKHAGQGQMRFMSSWVDMIEGLLDTAPSEYARTELLNSINRMIDVEIGLLEEQENQSSLEAVVESGRTLSNIGKTPDRMPTRTEIAEVIQDNAAKRTEGHQRDNAMAAAAEVLTPKPGGPLEMPPEGFSLNEHLFGTRPIPGWNTGSGREAPPTPESAIGPPPTGVPQMVDMDFSREGGLAATVAQHPLEDAGIPIQTPQRPNDAAELMEYYRQNGTTEGYERTEPLATTEPIVAPDQPTAQQEQAVTAMQAMTPEQVATAVGADPSVPGMVQLANEAPIGTARMLHLLGLDSLPPELLADEGLKDSIKAYDQHLQGQMAPPSSAAVAAERQRLADREEATGIIRGEARRPLRTPSWGNPNRLQAAGMLLDASQATAPAPLSAEGTARLRASQGLADPKDVNASVKHVMDKTVHTDLNKLRTMEQLIRAYDEVLAEYKGVYQGGDPDKDEGLRKFLELAKAKLTFLLNPKDTASLSGAARHLVEIYQSDTSLSLDDRITNTITRYFTGADSIAMIKADYGAIKLDIEATAPILMEKLTPLAHSLVTPGTNPVYNTHIAQGIRVAHRAKRLVSGRSEDPYAHLIGDNDNVSLISEQVFGGVSP